MNDSDKIKMTINIGGEIIPLLVNFDSQNEVRDAEAAVAKIFAQWKLKWPGKSDSAILAMAAYQFAFLYHALLKRHEEAKSIALDCLDKADSLINGIEL